MSAGFTPGPWHTNGNSSPITGAITVYHRPFGLGDIAEVHCIEDARLIAAAPELLAALYAIEPFIPKTSANEGGAAKHSANVRAADAVRAAIAKATKP